MLYDFAAAILYSEVVSIVIHPYVKFGSALGDILKFMDFTAAEVHYPGRGACHIMEYFVGLVCGVTGEGRSLVEVWAPGASVAPAYCLCFIVEIARLTSEKFGSD